MVVVLFAAAGVMWATLSGALWWLGILEDLGLTDGFLYLWMAYSIAWALVLPVGVALYDRWEERRSTKRA